MRLHFLVTLIVCALVASRQDGWGVAADNELQDVPEVGTLEAIEDDELPPPPEPGSTMFQVQNGSVAGGGGQGPPEPSTRPAFSGGANTLSQGPPEPSTRPAFSGGASSQSPPEPSTRPAFSGSTNTLNQGPPEPATRPVFSGGSTSSATVQGPPEPSTRPAFSEPARQPASAIPEPSRGQPVYTTLPASSSSSSGSSASRTVAFVDGPPEPQQEAVFVRESNYRPATRPAYTTPRPTQVVVRPAPSQPARYPYQPYPTQPSYPNTYPSYPYYPRERYQQDPSQNGLDTPTLVTTRYNRPFTQQVWRCDMAANNCFLKNKFNFVPFERQNYFENTYYALVLDVGKAAARRHGLTRRPNPVYSYNAARLETTSYFPANNGLPQYADACIAFSYYWSGQGKKSVHVLQRITDDDCIYSNVIDPADANSLRTLGQWQDVQLQVDLRQGAAKFWIEWQFDLGHKNETYPYYANLGYLAIRNFTIGYGTCQHNNAWECDIPLSR